MRKVSMRNNRRRGTSSPRPNVGESERQASVIAGAVCELCAIKALLLFRPGTALLWGTAGGFLLGRGMTGRSMAYSAMGVRENDATRNSNPVSRSIHARKSITVAAPAQELFARWRKLDDLPRIMKHVKRVEVLDEKRSRWTVSGPAGTYATWESQITSEEPGRFFEWRSTPDSVVETRGRVEFIPAPENRGTVIIVDLEYRPIGGVLGAAAAKLLGATPEHDIIDDLRKFKQLVESGEVADNESPSGRERLAHRRRCVERRPEGSSTPLGATTVAPTGLAGGLESTAGRQTPPGAAGPGTVS